MNYSPHPSTTCKKSCNSVRFLGDQMMLNVVSLADSALLTTTVVVVWMHSHELTACFSLLCAAAPWTNYELRLWIKLNMFQTGLHANTNKPTFFSYSTLICCHHLQMPTLLIFGIKVSPLCCPCGVSLLWSPDQSRLWLEMTLTESQATKERVILFI